MNGARLHVPELDRLIGTAGGQKRTVAGAGKGQYGLAVSIEGGSGFTGAGVPDLHRAVVASARQRASGVSEGDRVDSGNVAAKRLERRFLAGTPDLDGAIGAAGNQELAHKYHA